MSIERISDHDSTGLTLLLEQFKGKTNVEAVVSAFMEQVQDLETAYAWYLDILEDIEIPAGVNLDVLGRIVGQEREGRSDATYMAWIKARILLNRSSGTIPEIIKLVQLIAELDVDQIRIQETYPAALIVYGLSVGDITGDIVLDLLNLIRAAGVRVNYVATVAEPYFRFSDDPSVAFSDDAGVGGGYWSEIF